MSFVLNFHGIGSAKRPYEEGEEPYWIDEETFSACLDIAGASKVPVEITFDDGNDSDYLIAVPELRKRGLKATFFVLAGKLDKPGYLTSEQVREIDADPLFSIGSHGMDHQPWPLLGDDELLRETVRSQHILEELCGRRIDAAGLPFGRYDRRVMRRLANQGYTTIYSSDGSPRLGSGTPIPRFSMRTDTQLAQLASRIEASRGFVSRLRRELTSRLKSLQ
ncbi:MAG: polysaccharide deacetylase family protein [Erythrobacter sp.]